MAVDNTKLNYYSGWDIDLLYATAEVAVSAGTIALYTIPSDLPTLPEFEVQFKPTGSSLWFQEGTYSPDSTLASATVFATYIQSGTVYIVCGDGTARYFIWADKVNY